MMHSMKSFSSLALLLAALVLPLSGIAQNASAPYETTTTMRQETRGVVHFLEKIHYAGRPVATLDHEAFIDDYMQNLDSNRMLFLQEDAVAFKERFAPLMPRFLNQGELYAAFVIFDTYKQRLHERIQWIKERLEKPIDLDTSLTFVPDRREAPWPANSEEADALWEQRLQFELINEILARIGREEKALKNKISKENPGETPSDIDYTVLNDTLDWEQIKAEAVEKVRDAFETMRRRVDEMDPADVQELFLTTLARQYDPHSNFLSADSLEEFSIAMRNSLVGIGAVLSDKDGYCTVQELLPGGPAERSKEIKPGDVIIGVGQGADGKIVDTIGMKLRNIVKMIRGKQGSVVRLIIRPADGDPSERREVVLTRDEIKLTANLAKAEVFEVPGEDTTFTIGVIDLPAFYGSGQDDGKSSTTRDVEELIEKLKTYNVEGIVLDLRRNGGGLLSEAIDLTGLFIPVGPVVQVKNPLGQVQEYLDTNPKVVWDGPLVVLVSRYSASASEIVAGALQVHGRAIVVGDEETHGKGTVQAVYEMDRGGFLSALRPQRGAAKVTVQKYYLPDGSSTQIKGIHSDIPLPSINPYLPIGESDLPNAMEWDTIEALKWDYGTNFSPKGLPINESLISQLALRSRERQDTLPEFQYLKENIEWLRNKQEQKSFSLNLEKRREQRTADMEFRQAQRKKFLELANNNFTSSEVLLKITEEQDAEHRAIVAEISESQKSEDAELSSSPDALASGEVEEESLPDFDIHLRESLRIMADWLKLNRRSKVAESTESVASADSTPRS